MKKYYTDYPFDFLGDKQGQQVPVREIQIVAFDGNKYVDILVEGQPSNIKAGYIYLKRGRCGIVPSISYTELEQFING